MKAIQPVHLHETGPKVSNLHQGLLFIVLHQPGISDHDRKILQRRLAPEVKADNFGDATAELVGIWQYQLKNWPDYLPKLPPPLKDKVQKLPVSMGRGNGDVDGVTAEALNWLLKEFDALKPE
ncbi:hypothetical protein [Bradyrhizobium sp. Ec3.3]|uniref:hypothetical protein n=1 Tax=Bradyrhizobium sp. Ec3.3 TaxID=189753 RepID=UPI00040F9FBE|nr:hypothetical protein [Bradyrhizobium sp. Ec3.3]